MDVFGEAKSGRAERLGYDGAKIGRRTDGWLTGNTSADSEIDAARFPIRDRARDLVRNDAHAKKGLEVIVSNKVGTGIMCQPSSGNVRLDRKIAKRWKRWAKRCDIRGKLDIYGMQSLAERTRSESGEALIRQVYTPMVDREDVPFRLQLLEPDFIDDSRDIGFDRQTGVQTKRGIVYRNGIPTGYWLYDQHPGDNTSATSRLVPASEVIHYFKPLRPGQSRGVTDFHPVIAELKDHGDWKDAKLMRAKISACSVGAVTTPGGLPGASLGPVEDDDDGQNEQFEPGLFHYFKPGESVEFFDPKPLDDSKFNSDVLHAVAAGLCIPYELLTGDLSAVNYSSIRAGLVQFFSMIEVDQFQLLIPQVCERIAEWFIEELAKMDASVSPEAVTWVYTPPRLPLLDPGKEVPPKILELQSGLESYPNMQRRDGYDWKEKLAEIAEAKAEIDRLGLTLTSDARTLSKPSETAKNPEDEADATAAA